MSNQPTQNDDTTLKLRLNADIKTALLGGDKQRTEVLRGIKSAILYVEVAKGARATGLPESELQAVISKESKKRQESADLYFHGGNPERANAELAEKAIIDNYLPTQLTESEISSILGTVVAKNGPITKQTMGATIAAVKQLAGPAGDGGLIARLVMEQIL